MVVNSREHTYDRSGFPDLALFALSNPARRWMLRRALRNYLSIAALARDQEMSMAGVQKHVTVLENSGLVVRYPRGRETLVRADLATLVATRSVIEALESFHREASHPAHWWERL
jgi:DNA-binding transcriptional ArsR family regulator